MKAETFSKAQERLQKKLQRHPDAVYDCRDCGGTGISWHSCGHVECHEPCSCIYKKLRRRELYRQLVGESLKSNNYELLKDYKGMKQEVDRREVGNEHETV